MAVRWRGLRGKAVVGKLTGNRLTVVIAIGLVTLLTGSVLLFGVGVSSARPELANIGAWLASAINGEVSHANGLSGQVDARVKLASAKAGKLKVVEDGSSVLVVDEETGAVSRIDPTQLNVAQTGNLGASGMQLVAGGGKTYAVDPRKGTVQQIDPLNLNTLGSPVALKPPLGQAGLDKHGTLWVPVPAEGKVAQVKGAQQGTAVDAGEPGDPLSLTMAQGVPVVTNSASATAMVIGPTATRLKVSLPSTVTEAGRGGVLAPAHTEGPIVPILAPRQGALVLVDTAGGSLDTVSVRGGKLGAPQALGRRVYIPDEGSGTLIVYDAAAGRFDPEVSVTGKAGDLEVFVKDGLLWVNDQGSETALVVQQDGSTHRVGKYGRPTPGPNTATITPIPIPTSVPSRQPVTPPRPTGKAGNTPGPTATVTVTPTPTVTASPSPTPTGTRTSSPRPTPTPTPTPTPPSAPSTVTAHSGPGWIEVTFSPSGTGTPTGYTLKGASGDVSPSKVSPDGPFQFKVTGGDCAQEYSFRVAAEYDGGEAVSEPSIPVRPCVAPGKPSGFEAKAKNHGADLTWSAPENAKDGATYVLSGPGDHPANPEGTNAEVTGLKNGQEYTWTIKARNNAGESQEQAEARANLQPPPAQFQNANNDDRNTLIRPGPSADGEAGTILKGQYITLTVLCQVKGAHYTDTDTNQSSDVWNKVESGNGNGYLNDVLMATPKGGFPAAPLWECE
ncbi:hypothetical protein [Streptosporangium sp. KLBMP 9127]|nr:hypothetical protein [Streptosporangium sp. KLBMP 9127]